MFHTNSIHTNAAFGRSAVFAALLFATVLCLTGCEEKTVQRLEVQQQTKPVVRARPCSVLIVAKEELTEPLRRQWQARKDSELTVTTVSETEFIKNKFLVDDTTNVIIYPSHLMVDLIDKRRIDPINNKFYDGDEFNKRSLLKHYRKSGMRYDEKIWAVPCGTPMFSQFYRADVLSALDAEVPTTWSALMRVINALEQWESNDGLPNKVALPLAKGSAADSFLAVCGGYVRQFGRLSVLFDRKTMKPLLNAESFVRALEELKSIAASNPKTLDMAPADVWNQLQTGDLAIGLTWPQPLPPSDSIETDKNAQTEKNVGAERASISKERLDQLSATIVPGSAEYFDGRSQQWVQRKRDSALAVNYFGMGGLFVSPVASGGRQQSAEQFMTWISEPEISALLFSADADAGPFRATQLASPESYLPSNSAPELAQQWAETIRTAHDSPLILTFPRILESRRYLELLDDGIRDCLLNDSDPATALDAIVASWEALTEEIGRKRQTVLLGRNSNF